MKFSTLLICSTLLLVSVTTVHLQAQTTPGGITQCSTPGVVAYTFDDGPGVYNNLLLSKLAEKNVTATFFVL
jgi:peptidoglycan/xylan/chitin deacetylase (PgdA/CDA1 family)